MVKYNQVPVFFSIFSIFVNIKNLNFFIVMMFTVAANSFFKVLDVFVIEFVDVVGFRFIISKSKEAILLIK